MAGSECAAPSQPFHATRAGQVTRRPAIVNNAVARAGSLFAVAALPAVVGLSGDEYDQPATFDAAYGHALLICAALLAAGGLLSWVTIPHQALQPPERRDEEPRRAHIGGHQIDCPHCGH